MRLILRIIAPIFIFFLILNYRISTDLIFDCEDFSCWDGIIMGETTSDEVARLLAFRYGAENFSMTETGMNWHPELASTAVLFTENGTSNELFVHFPDDQITIEQIISRLGNPDSVTIRRRGSSVCDRAFVLFYDEGLIVWLIQRTAIVGVYPEQVVEVLQMAQPEQIASLPLESEPIEWQGYVDYCELFYNQSSPQP